jgi:hypothetical protein
VGHHGQHIRHRHHGADRCLQDLPGAPWLHHGPNLGSTSSLGMSMLGPAA